MEALMMGDCLEEMKRIPDGAVDMVFADLPYGVTCNKWDTVIPLEPLWAQLLRVGKKNCAFVFTATQPFTTTLINSQPKLFRYDLIWDKTRASAFAYAKRRPLLCHEHLLVFYTKISVYNAQKTFGHLSVKSRSGGSRSTNWTCQPKPKPSDDSRYPLTIVHFKRDDPRKGVKRPYKNPGTHPTQKPVALLEWLIKTYSNPGDLVLDPTMGSGTTGVACRNTGRHFVGIEKDPTYFATAEKRIGEAA